MNLKEYIEIHCIKIMVFAKLKSMVKEKNQNIHFIN